MAERKFHIRRARRTDFTAVMRLLAVSGLEVPPADRATLRRFRNIVADLGTDFYLVLVDGTLAGLVHVTYARQLRRLPRAGLEQLLVAEPFRRRGVASALLAFARERARRRGCTALYCVVPITNDSARQFLEQAGLTRCGESFVEPLHAEQ